MNHSTIARTLNRGTRLSVIAMLLGALVDITAPPSVAGPGVLIIVNSDADGALKVLDQNTTCDLREAIEAVNTNGTVNQCVHDGTIGTETIIFAADYTITLVGAAGEDDNASGDLDILGGSSLIIQGRGAGSTIVDGGGNDRVFHVCPGGGVTFSGLTIRNGDADYGGGIYNDGTLTVDGSTVISNTANSSGGGIWNNGGLTLDGSTVSGNTATSGDGGGIYNGGTLNVQNGSAIGGAGAPNQATNGGGIRNDGTLTVDGSTVSGNTATLDGGGIYNEATLNVQSGSAIGGAGAPNQATNGGGILNDGTLTVDGSTVSGNTAVEWGGGICNWGVLIITNSTIGEAGVGNQALGTFGLGGGIYNGSIGTATVDGSTFSDNTATLDGGGIYNQGTLNVQNGSTIGGAGAGNQAGDDGGGIYNGVIGTATVTGSRILENTATMGGGVYNDRDLAGATSVTGSCIVGNSDTSFFNNQAAQQIATSNWWGAASGPSGVGPGKGDSVSADMSYTPFLTAAPAFCLYTTYLPTCRLS